ncbi:hypothetical protein STVIR_6955 [Streptomyces viridochromogenes Tue57]|uniref:Uncharacterized protein n=1 Tax=Streptomyces viridochromogenes Tue57 TaxID=1160705 RepID=L8P6X1_STRVR|nr:hypothetical protein STVIR_6955 [Streptomyces viridochromogenes Tue57]
MRGDGPVLAGCGRTLVRDRRAQNRAHESGPSRPVDRPPLGGPVLCPVRKGGPHLTARMSGTPCAHGELACLAGHRKSGSRSRGTTRRHVRTPAPSTPLPRPAPGLPRSLSPPLEPLADSPMRVRCTTVLTIETVWQELERALTFLLV